MYVLAPGALVSFNVTYLMECHPHSPFSKSVVDYSPIYLEEEKYSYKSFLWTFGCLAKYIYCKILTIEVTEIVRTVNCIIMGNTTSGSRSSVNYFTGMTTASARFLVVLQE